MADGKNNLQSANHLGIHRETVQQAALVGRSSSFNRSRSDTGQWQLLAMIEELLKDEPREGTPIKFTAEQVTQIIL